MLIDKEHWSDWANGIAHPADIMDYSPAAMERMMNVIHPYVVDVKGVRSQFNAHNRVELISFKTKEERAFYDAAWDRYEMMKRKIEGYDLSGGQSAFLILAQFTIFRKAAELCRAEYLADLMYEAVQNGKAACVAVSFKGTIRRIRKILYEKYGVQNDDVSLIWGGGKTKKTKKQKKAEVITKDAVMMELLKECGITTDVLGIADVEEYVDDDPADDWTSKLDLGTQSMKARQDAIDRFQSGKSHYCMFTFKAGGVGLSLHHTDEFTKQKCRRTKNNWVVEEDIPLIPTRPRVCYLAPTFSAIELVQGLGRCPRLTSLSDTEQIIIFYGGTIESRVAAIVSQKLRCLRKVVRTRESWESCIVGGIGKDDDKDTTEIVTTHKSATPKVELDDDDDDDTQLFGGGDDDDDED